MKLDIVRALKIVRLFIAARDDKENIRDKYTVFATINAPIFVYSGEFGNHLGLHYKERTKYNIFLSFRTPFSCQTPKLKKKKTVLRDG